ncbi:MAG: FAD-dependent oxidoreductase [Planctomycetota bacterium]
MSAEGKPILVIGGGIAGMTAAVEAAEYGCRVVLVEKEAYLGGRVLRTHRYFPKMCPPACGFEVNSRRVRENPRIAVHTLSTVKAISGRAGAFRVRIRRRPRFVTGDGYLDATMAAGLTATRADEFNLGMNRIAPLYLPHPMAFPAAFVVDRESLSDADGAKLLQHCPPGAIDLDMAEEDLEIEVGAIVVATGWRPYDASRLDHLGYGRCPNVVTNVMVERLAARDGPTGGEIVRPSDGAKARHVAFVQCAGSRDENHLPYCSAVCCMGSLKQVRYLRDKNEGARATVFYIDIRTVGRHEDFYHELVGIDGVSFVKGKVARIDEIPVSRNLRVHLEDTLAGTARHDEFDLVVLATGIVPNTAELPTGDGQVPFPLPRDGYGFLAGGTLGDGIFAAGCVKRPSDVSRVTKDATAAALKAVQCLNGRR